VTWISDHVVRTDIFLAKHSQVSVSLHVCVTDRFLAVPSNATFGDHHMKLDPKISGNPPAVGKRKASHNLNYVLSFVSTKSGGSDILKEKSKISDVREKKMRTFER
jgi:hypothetical protein